jgi:hypothetical protein
MTDKPKRKRSESVGRHNKLLLRWLMGLYSLFLLPYFVNIWYLLTVSIALLLAAGMLWINSYFVKLLNQSRGNLLTKTIALLILSISAFFLCAVLIVSAMLGLAILVNRLSYPISLLEPPLEFIAKIGTFILTLVTLMLPPLCLAFTIELLAAKNAIPSVTFRKSKRKNIIEAGIEHELEGEPDISPELLVDSESAKQKMK